MATVINNPGPSNGDGGNSGGGSGVVIGVVLAIVILGILFFYVLPNMGGNAPADPAPAANDGGGDTTIEVPDEIDVNVEN